MRSLLSVAEEEDDDDEVATVPIEDDDDDCDECLRLRCCAEGMMMLFDLGTMNDDTGTMSAVQRLIKVIMLTIVLVMCDGVIGKDFSSLLGSSSLCYYFAGLLPADVYAK